MPSAPKQKGFTLIELLVTISIIAVLAAVGMVVYSSTQKAGRISKRVQDLKSIRTAIELFKTAQGRYPVAASFICVKSLPASFTPSGGTASNNKLTPNTAAGVLSDGYMPQVPDDPSGPDDKYCYEYKSDASGNEYKIRTHVTVGTGTPPSLTGLDDMTSNDFLQQRALIDPAQDGGSQACDIDPGSPPVIKAWAFYAGPNGCGY
jgi:prepilin-type N-terminal cleavage/methylation domain-containing protein